MQGQAVDDLQNRIVFPRLISRQRDGTLGAPGRTCEMHDAFLQQLDTLVGIHHPVAAPIQREERVVHDLLGSIAGTQQRGQPEQDRGGLFVQLHEPLCGFFRHDDPHAQLGLDAECA